MSLEVMQFINDFDVNNPPSGDQVAQGDDHIRGMKTALKATFPNATRHFYLPDVAQKTASYTIVQGDQNKLIFCNTALGAVTLTLPSISGSPGWSCKIVKWTLDLNPVFVVPPSGVLQSGQITDLTKTRRAIPGIICDIIWTGGVWFVQRAITLPIGSVIPHYAAALPYGYEWANGQTLVAADYPEYASLVSGGGSTPDLRGRVPFGNNTMSTSAFPARITSGGSGISGDVLGSVGGTESIEILPGHLRYAGVAAAAGGDYALTSNTVLTSSGGSITELNKMPPTIIMNYALVVE